MSPTGLVVSFLLVCFFSLKEMWLCMCLRVREREKEHCLEGFSYHTV